MSALPFREIARHALSDGTIGVIAVTFTPPRRRAMRGWTRIDPRPWGKLGAVWRRDDGAFLLVHGSHPTALRPWMLFDGEGNEVTSRKFPRLLDALEWIARRR
jgi:hypothetical protein